GLPFTRRFLPGVGGWPGCRDCRRTWRTCTRPAAGSGWGRSCGTPPCAGLVAVDLGVGRQEAAGGPAVAARGALIAVDDDVTAPPFSGRRNPSTAAVRAGVGHVCAMSTKRL